MNNDTKYDRSGDGIQDWKGRRYTLLILLVAVSALFLTVVRDFLVSILVAATFVTLFNPLNRRIVNMAGGRKGTASFITCLVLIICVFLPLAYIIAEMTDQAIDMYKNVQPWIKNVLNDGNDGILAGIRESKLYGWLNLDRIDWQKAVQEIAGRTGSVVASVLNKTSRSLFELVTTFFVVFFTMFYLFRDGERILSRMRYLSPLKDEYEMMIYERFVEISKATVRGTVAIGLIQGFLGTVILFSFGFSSWLVFGVIMAILSIVPLLGPWIVLVPAGVIKMLTGDIWQGIAIILLTVFIVSLVDNLLRPRLVGREAGMHDLLIFFSTLGGISLFGVAGFIVGPLVAALFLTVIDIWGKEFGAHLNKREQ